jgi:hypothetical protein
LETRGARRAIWHICTKWGPRACMDDPCAFILLLVGLSWIVGYETTAVNDTFRGAPSLLDIARSISRPSTALQQYSSEGKAVRDNISVELVRLFMTVPRVHIYRIMTNRQVVSRPQYGAGPRLRNDEPTTRDHAIDAMISCV